MILLSILLPLLTLSSILTEEVTHSGCSGCEQQVIIVPSLDALTKLPQFHSLMKPKKKTELISHKDNKRIIIHDNKNKHQTQKKQQTHEKLVESQPPLHHKQSHKKHHTCPKKRHHHKHPNCRCYRHHRRPHHCRCYSEPESSSSEDDEYVEREYHEGRNRTNEKHQRKHKVKHASQSHKTSKKQHPVQHAWKDQPAQPRHIQNKSSKQKHGVTKVKTRNPTHQQNKHHHFMARFLCHVFPEQQQHQGNPSHHVEQWIDLDHLSAQPQFQQQHHDSAVEYFSQKVQVVRITLAYIGIPLDVLLLVEAPPEVISIALSPMQQYFDAIRKGTKAKQLKQALLDYMQTLQQSNCNTQQLTNNPVFSNQSIRQLLCLRDHLAQNSLLSPRIQHIHSRIPYFIQTTSTFEPTVFTAVLPKQQTSLHSLTLFFTAALNEARSRWQDFPSRIQSITRYINKHLVNYLNTGHHQ